MITVLYYKSGLTRVRDHYNPKLRGSKLNGERPVAIIIRDLPKEDYLLCVNSAIHTVSPYEGYVSVEVAQ